MGGGGGGRLAGADQFIHGGVEDSGRSRFENACLVEETIVSSCFCCWYICLYKVSSVDCTDMAVANVCRNQHSLIWLIEIQTGKKKPTGNNTNKLSALMLGKKQKFYLHPLQNKQNVRYN